MNRTTFLAAAVNGRALMHSLLYLVVIGVVIWIVWALIDYLVPAEPLKKILRVVVALVAGIFLIDFVLGLISEPFIRW